MNHIETVSGNGILADALAGLESYVVVTDPVPWRMHEHRFVRKPVQVFMPGTLDKAELDAMAADIADGVDFVGVGGGTAVDAAKYFAYLRGKAPVLVPTILSSNAIYSDFISIRKHGSSYGFRQDGWPKRVIADYDLIRLADPVYNRAGFGDLLFLRTTLNDWRIAARRGKAIAVDPTVERAIDGMMREAMDGAKEVGALTQAGLELLLSLCKETTGLVMDHPAYPISAGAEHLFSWNLDIVAGRHLIHGETVSLGMLIAAHLQRSDYAGLKQALDDARVRYHPAVLGLEWPEIRETLLTVCDYNRRVRHFHTVFEEVEWTPSLLAEIRELIYG